ncbi:hypothetical protein BJF93_04060 [Xaviernesmea oryzae]|uniref:DUF218 domain-containing protein n=1 Tax=Xaviernesmea oryzae TaxID=464029 RepID=A0A1Q9AUI9_9HYPH|nr:YdcF family protein [Xaviernesmea oryzae]OLP59102.1 hypothetical protein BJF93_04060 [Xaviernesmea oryzae]SEK86583.1 Uncharacterized SAM-binding protein YcdF, DUF218 family [Xaviernesmea oryzae]
MFLISKILWLVAQPLSLVFLLLLVSALLLSLGLSRTGIFALLLAMLLLFTALFTTTGSVLLQRLEDRFARPDSLPADLACIVILGGAFENEVMAARGGIEFNQAADRFVEGARLAKLHPQARILVSGGDGSFSGAYQGDADAAADFFALFDLPPERLMKENVSRTTFENARQTQALLKEAGLARCALITSAFHMPRAIGLFRKQGLEMIPWPSDYRTTGRARLGLDFTQPSLNAQLLTTALREWTGLAAYYATGRTTALFPDKAAAPPL